MNVPGDLVEDRLKHVDRHKPHVAFDQPTGEQTPLPEAVHAVLLTHLLGFVPELKGLTRLRRGHERVGLMEGGVHELGVLVRLEIGHGLVNLVAPASPAVHPYGSDVVGRKHVRNLEVGG